MNDLAFASSDPAVSPPVDLSSSIRGSISAKLERLLQRPLIATIPRRRQEPPPPESGNDVLDALLAASLSLVRTPPLAWHEDEDGSFVVPVDIDYRDRWRGYESEVREAVSGCVESFVSFLTDEQRLLLERAPREFLDLMPRPETVELLDFDTEFVGGAERVVRLRVASRPESLTDLRHVAVVPNLIPLERQLDGLRTVERATDDGPLGPLRALVGVCDDVQVAARLAEPGPRPGAESHGRLDEHQLDCVAKALSTPHFAVLQGPPGSGKTTVITRILEDALRAGQRVLVVSPTHVAVDNVVEKLVPAEDEEDPLDPGSMPVRYAARKNKLSADALRYWVSAKKQYRAATIAVRLQNRLERQLPLARALFARLDEDAAGTAVLSAAVTRRQLVTCGTPIGILSCEAVKNAEPGAYDLLIVDEVSKMTLPEFLAVAVKARRWVLVGDPEQLPPYLDPEDNAVTLNDLLEPEVELACSVASILERTPPRIRHTVRQIVVCRRPEVVAALATAHVGSVLPDEEGRVAAWVPGLASSGFVVCTPDEVDEAFDALIPVRDVDRTHNPALVGAVGLLVERGLSLPRPTVGSGMRFVSPRLRAQAALFDKAGNTYHAQPWAERSRMKLQVVMFRNGLDKLLPSPGLLATAAPDHPEDPVQRRSALLERIAERFAVNALSVYDWLTGFDADAFDRSPLVEVRRLGRATLGEAVAPYTGTLRRQYRMHPSLSEVPRALFYFGEALHDGRPGDGQSRVRLMQVDRGSAVAETNVAEAEAISRVISSLARSDLTTGRAVRIMVITPYRAQERLLQRHLEDAGAAARQANIEVDVCTLDRCQGREAEYVFISLVRRRATPFMDIPKRWNVALTRAKEALFLVGDIEAFLSEASRARRDPRLRGAVGRRARPKMSLLARILEAYEEQDRRARMSR